MVGRKTLKSSEDDELIAFFKYIEWQSNKDLRLSYIYHIANERRSSWAAGKRLKKNGVKAGVPDVFVPIPTKKHPGLYMEFKVDHNKPTDRQEYFLTGLASLGYVTKVVYSATEAIDVLNRYLCDSV